MLKIPRKDYFHDYNEDKRKLGKLIKRLQMLKRDFMDDDWERAQDVQAAIDEIYHIFRTIDDKFFFQTITDVRREVRNILRNYGLSKYVQY